MEEMTTRNIASCGVKADIMKFFDQNPRDLIYEVCRSAGMPTKTLAKYAKFPEGPEGQEKHRWITRQGVQKESLIATGMPPLSL